jgi:hypothetical protein
MTFPKEFKEAISRLHSAEKDKLIFRLLKHDLNLANRLHFELVSCDSKEDKRKQAKKEIEHRIEMSKRHAQYSTPGILMMYMREASGFINEHVQITKDKYGEIYLQIFLLKEFLEIYNKHLKKSTADKSHTLNVYCVSKAFKIMILLKKIHEDTWIDFADDLEETGRLFGDNPALMKTAIHNGLDVNWLIRNDIPENIAGIEKDLRLRGYLK